MATIHNVLAKVQNEGVAKLFYAHPAIQKTSLILNNRSVIKAEKGAIVKLAIKLMPSGKRILLNCSKREYKSIDEFIKEVGEDVMVKAAAREVASGYPRVESFDGVQDKNYLISSYLRRFSDDDETERVTEEEEEIQSDGYTDYGELYVPDNIVRALNAVKGVCSVMGAANVLLVGPSGNGKTSLAKQFADENGLSFTKVNCSVVRDPEEWFGYREAQDGSTIFVESDFTKAVKAGNAVVLLDEINRLEPFLHNSLMPLLDETRHTMVHGNEIKVGKNVTFFCTMNLGAGFVGTFLLDNAIKNRMDMTIVMPKLSFEREVRLLINRTSIEAPVASKIVTMLEHIRDAASKNEIDVDVSHRSALKIARLVKTSLLDIKEAITFVIFNNADSVDQAKTLVDSIMGE